MSGHMPACPRCGDLCDPAAVRCDCGAALYLSAGQGRARAIVPPARSTRVAALAAEPDSFAEWWANQFTSEELKRLAEGFE